MTVILRGADSAFPPNNEQIAEAERQGVRWWGGYVGGEDAYHVWSTEDFARVGAHFKILCIWVPVQFPASFNVADTVAGFLDRLRALGVPNGTWVALDEETELSRVVAASPSTQKALVDGIAAGGYHLLQYGNGNLVAPEWQASWYGSSWPISLPPGDGEIVAWQWTSGSMSALVPGADLDVMTQGLFDALWDGKPKLAADTASTAPKPVVQEPKPVVQEPKPVVQEPPVTTAAPVTTQPTVNTSVFVDPLQVAQDDVAKSARAVQDAATALIRAVTRLHDLALQPKNGQG